jgi:hypothetical protein
MKNKTHFIFDKNGKFLKSFAPRGEGPGEIIMMDDEEFFIINDKVIIADYGKINYYKKNGEYIKSASNSIRKRLPHFFLNEEAFIYAPIFKSQMPDRKGNIGKFNLKTGRDKILFQFSLSETEKLDNKPQLIIFPLTPTMVIGYCNERIYYGMSDSYRVNIADLKGNALGSFTLKREKGKVSDEFIIKFLTQMGEPADLAKEWAKSLPRELTFFSHIEEHNNLIYIFKTQWGPGARENQQIDIFSLEGKYLYRAFIKPERDSTISIQHRKSIIIKKDFLYLAFQDKEGENRIAKYAVRLPSAL